MRLWGATASHVGNVREINQDRVYFRGYIAALADGMGGHQGGERAAELAIGEFRIVRAQLTQAELVDVVEEANRQVHHQAADPSLRGMGTTMVALGLHGNGTMTVANVGDSRAYWLRGDYLAQITEDHSFVEDLVRQGRLSPEEAIVHPQRNILTRALGIADDVLVDRFDLEPKVGDRFLLCSDGLFNEVSIPDITQILLDNEDPAPAAEALIAASLATPCRDNVTVAVVNVVDDEHPAVVNETDIGINLTPPERITDQLPIVGPSVVRITDRPEDATNGHNGNQPPSLADDVDEHDIDDYADEPAIAGNAAMTYEITQLVDDRRPTSSAAVGDQAPVNGGPGRRPMLWRLVGLAVLAAVLAGAYFGGRAYNQSLHHVDVVDGELVIFQGRQGGLLFFGREQQALTAQFYDDLTDASQATVDGWGNFSSFTEAQASVDNLERQPDDPTVESGSAESNITGSDSNTVTSDDGGSTTSQDG